MTTAALERLASRLADPDPAFWCESLDGSPRTLVRVTHLGGAPADDAALAWLTDRVGAVAPSLLDVWRRWNGLVVAAERDDPANCLVQLHPIGDAMLDATENVRAWVEELALVGDFDDPDHLADAIAIGGPPHSADALIVLTRGSRAGEICWFDHETLRAEPFAASAHDLVGRLADDIESFRPHVRYRWAHGQVVPVVYVADARGL